MRLLLDENLPKKLKKDFPEHHIVTLRDKDWEGRSNGILLQLMISEKYDALLTFDQNIQHQQNFTKYSIAVIVLTAADNSYITLKTLVPKIKELFSKDLLPGPIEVKE